MIKSGHLSFYTSSTIAELKALEHFLDTLHDLQNPERAALLTDSRAALQILSNLEDAPPIARIIAFKVESLEEKGWTIAFQWLPSHCGIDGNERADRITVQAHELTNSTLHVPKINEARLLIAQAELPPCSLGARGCHVTTQTKTRSLINAQDLTHTDRRLLSLRSGRPQGDIRTVLVIYHVPDLVVQVFQLRFLSEKEIEVYLQVASSSELPDTEGECAGFRFCLGSGTGLFCLLRFTPEDCFFFGLLLLCFGYGDSDRSRFCLLAEEEEEVFFFLGASEDKAVRRLSLGGGLCLLGLAVGVQEAALHREEAELAARAPSVNMVSLSAVETHRASVIHAPHVGLLRSTLLLARSVLRRTDLSSECS
ncbi:hypothetical protein HPB47_002728 [Ixodes persulcatus]|uniref:Uncharacterized protein n=1 Tax=Ixodes persulcatus TaxID=34615 RepID=A0AC60PLK2_IXOPE|nr:hypothetical protein HPB47_002728 [Ixodes persulcatus]